MTRRKFLALSAFTAIGEAAFGVPSALRTEDIEPINTQSAEGAWGELLEQLLGRTIATEHIERDAQGSTTIARSNAEELWDWGTSSKAKGVLLSGALRNAFIYALSESEESGVEIATLLSGALRREEIPATKREMMKELTKALQALRTKF